MNSSKHSGLFKYDMRPVYRSNSTNQKWMRIKSPVRFQKQEDGNAFIYFEHIAELPDDRIYFAFTYPYTYSMVQNDLQFIDNHVNNTNIAGSIYCTRELLTTSVEGRRVDLITITSVDGADTQSEALIPGLFPETTDPHCRPLMFPHKEVVFVSSRVHPGEVRQSLNTILFFIVF